MLGIKVEGSTIIDQESGQSVSLAEMTALLKTAGEAVIDVGLRRINFSRLVAEIGCELKAGGDTAHFNFFAEFRGMRETVLDSYKGVIIGDTWHPIRQGDFARIASELNAEGFKIEYPRLDDAFRVNLAARDLNFKFDISIASTGAIQDIVGLQAEPYAYQSDGINYLCSLVGKIPGAILADEMGLGKTLQAIAVLLHVKQDSVPKPNLVLCPAALLENWSRELKKFAPSLRIEKREGNQRTYEPNAYQSVDVVITSYDTLVNDSGFLKRFDWGVVVADEAQYLKNPGAKRSIKAKELKAAFKLAVTGTPFENHMTDIWSLCDFVFRDFLGGLGDFKNVYPDTVQSAELLEPILAPILLRRRVTDVQKDLPERVDRPVIFEIPDNLAQAQIGILTASDSPAIAKLTKLRTIAAQAAGTFNDYVVSPKFEYLRQVLDSAFNQGEKVLIFSSFNQTAAFILKSIGDLWPSAYLDQINGDSPAVSRQEQVDAFAKAGFGALILNPKAAGVGLNITAARHVVHFNPEWNPALTEQATKRAHRNGQTKTVFVHYLGYRNSIEDIVFASQNFKQILGETIIPGVTQPLEIESALNSLTSRGRQGA